MEVYVIPQWLALSILFLVIAVNNRIIESSWKSISRNSMEINRGLIADCAKPRKNLEESDLSRIFART